MTKEELAAVLNGREYREEMTKEDEATAKANRLVVVFGASDDLMEFRGAIDEEIGAYDGTTCLIDQGGPLPAWDEVKDSEIEAYALFKRRQGKTALIEAVWCGGKEYSWTFKTEIPHATFDILEDGAKYCRGIVFSQDDLHKS